VLAWIVARPDDTMTLEEAVAVLQRIATAPIAYHVTLVASNVLDVIFVLMNRARAHEVSPSVVLD